MSEQQSKK